MAYGTVKIDTIIFDQGGTDQNVTASGIYRAITSGVTVTGTISGAVLIGTTTVSGATVTGTAVQGTTVQGVSGTFTSLTGTTTTGTTANFVSGVFTTRISGTTVTGDTGQFTSGSFVYLTGTTITGTTINAVTVSSTTGTFTSLTGTTITGTTINGVTVAATTGSFTSLTGTTTSGTTANFVSGVFTTQVSGTTVTGTTSNFTSGNFATLSGATATFTSGVIALGTATNPSLSFVGDPNTGIYSPGANELAVATNGTGRLFVDASGNVGVGAAPTTRLEVARLGNTWTGAAAVAGTALFLHNGNNSSGSPANLQISAGNATSSRIYFGDSDNASRGIIDYDHTDDHLHLSTSGSERLRITSTGLVGIGTSSPSVGLQVQDDSSFSLIRVVASSGNVAGIDFGDAADTDTAGVRYDNVSDSMAFRVNASERARIDSSGRLLVGTSSARANFFNSVVSPQFQIEGVGDFERQAAIISSSSTAIFGGVQILAHQKSGAIGGNTLVASGDALGTISFQGSDGTEFVEGARIEAFVDGTPGADDMPGRLMLYTTADGASAPTERMRIDSSGNVGIGTTSPTTTLDVNGDVKLASINGGPLAGFRNRIINGNFDIAQRGTSISSGVSALTYTLDRWIVAANTAAVTASQGSQTSAPYRFLSVTGAAGNTGVSIRQRIEAKTIRDLAGQQVTLSFFIYNATSNATSIAVQMDHANTEDNFSAATQFFTATLPSVSDTTRQSVTVTLPAEARNGVEVRFIANAITTGVFVLHTVQLEPGSVATPFEQRPIGTELALCQRYYERGNFRVDGTQPSFGTLSGMVYFKTVKRATPTIDQNNTGNLNSVATPGTANISDSDFNSFRGGTTGGNYAWFSETWIASIEL